MMRDNLLFLRAKVKEKNEDFFREYIDFFNLKLLNKEQLFLIDQVRVYPYPYDEKYILVFPLMLTPPWFFWPLSIIPKVVYAFALILKSRFKIGLMPVPNRVCAEVLFENVKK